MNEINLVFKVLQKQNIDLDEATKVSTYVKNESCISRPINPTF